MSAPAAPASPASEPGRLATALRAAATAPIVVYQRVISPLLPRRCKYEPTCSSYAVEAIRGFGIARGGVLAVWRLLRCNPWSYGGFDPVDAQRMFTASGTRSADAGRRQGSCGSPPKPV